MTDADSRFFLATLLCFTDHAALHAALANYAGSDAAAEGLITSGVGRLFSDNGNREILAKTAARVKLARGSPTSFIKAVAAMRNGELSENDEERLVQFYQQLSEHWLLVPLFDEPREGIRVAH